MSAIKDLIFVEVALRKAAIDQALLRQALANQAEMSRYGITRFIGAILVEKQPALRDTVARLVEELAEYAIRCPKCKEPAAVSAADRQGVIRCEPCSAPIVWTEDRISEDDLSTTIAAGASRPGRKKRPKDESRSAPPRPVAPLENRKAAAPPARKAAPLAAPHPPEPLPTAEVTKFRIEKLIAGSPSGKLYRIQPSGELGALKVIDRALCSEKAQLKKWIDYMQLAQDLPRSAMLKPAQLFREGSFTYVVRPFLEGSARSARSEIERGAIAAEGHVGFASQLLGALLSFHSANLVHGNLTPENVIITAEGARLTDPGLWILFQGLSGEERVVRLWERYRYHAPEVLRGCEPTPASDIYSVGRILEDLFRLSGEKQASTQAGLARFIGRMVAEDSVQRYPSAREALWDLRSGATLQRGPNAKDQGTEHHAEGSEPTGALDLKVAGNRRPRISAREKRLRLAGAALLSTVIVLLASQAASWYSTKKAIASAGRPEEVSATLLEEEISSMRKKDGDGAWKQLEETLRGTSWEEAAREASRRPLAASMRRRDGESAAKTAAAQARVDAGDWATAIAMLLPAGKETLSREARDVLVRAADGLYEKEGMVCVPGIDGPEGRTGPFLMDAAPLTKAAAGDGDSREPASGLSLDAVEEIARAQKKRLITGKEWDAAVRFARSASPRELAPERITGLEGSLLQWVEDEEDDDLAGAGYGFCRGGSRPLVPGTHPVRRKKSGSHPDVGARLARDLASVP